LDFHAKIFDFSLLAVTISTPIITISTLIITWPIMGTQSSFQQAAKRNEEENEN